MFSVEHADSGNSSKYVAEVKSSRNSLTKVFILKILGSCTIR